MNWCYLCVMSGLVFCHNAAGYDLLLNVQGAIADNGCVVSSDSQNMTVEIGQIALKQFYKSNIVYGKHPFVIKLEKCGASTTGVKVTFEGTADLKNVDLLQLTQDSDVAEGLALEILDKDGVTLPINKPSPAPLIIDATSGATNNLLFYAQYRSTDVVSSGSANATANFVLEYQ